MNTSEKQLSLRVRLDLPSGRLHGRTAEETASIHPIEVSSQATSQALMTQRG
jgi:hypothetical protein